MSSFEARFTRNIILILLGATIFSTFCSHYYQDKYSDLREDVDELIHRTSILADEYGIYDEYMDLVDRYYDPDY